MNTDTHPMYEWKTLPWSKIERCVFKLQKRIYKASQRDDIYQVHKLQKLLIKSRYAKLLAIRKVTQDNHGAKTAGVDGVKYLTGKQRMRLSEELGLHHRAKPLRRVWIPKPNSTEKRPLGIPVMRDRVLQALLKLALEPEWEARFEPNSYGFRPGRSAQDAIAAIFNCINQRAKWVLDADIEKCFDRINHQKLLDKVNTIPLFRQMIKGWLKAGILESDVFSETEAGTPQGGVISPLLANIALHGMEEYLGRIFRIRRIGNGKFSQKITFIRYADDFVVIHQDREVLEQCRKLLDEWLAEIGLAMKPSKTRLVHTLHPIDDSKPGFDFLGVTVRQFPVGRTHTGTDQRGNPLGYKTIIKPSKKSQTRHYQRMKEIIYRQRASPQESLIHELNSVIRGWSLYYAGQVSKDVYSRMDFLLFKSLYRWATRRHGGKHKKRIVRKYWRLEKGRWRFETRKEVKLQYHSSTPVVRHVKVKGNRSPFDGDWIYWGKRLGKYGGLTSRRSSLLKRQNFRCAYCGLSFTAMDLIEEDHLLPKIVGGKNDLRNCQLLHRHCHDQKTTVDGSYEARGSGIQRGAV